MTILNSLILSILCTATLFAAHAFPLNSRVIEPRMAQREDKKTNVWWLVGFFYYVVALLPTIYLFSELFLKQKK